MKTTEFHTGQKVTIFRCYPNQHFRINDKVGQIGTISNMWYYPDTDTHYAEVQLEDGSSEWFPTQMLELTPTLDQIKVGTRIQVAEHNRYINADYAGAYGTITKPYYGVDINVDMLPDDPALRYKWGTITLSGLNRFRILDQAPVDEPAHTWPGTPLKIYARINVTYPNNTIVTIYCDDSDPRTISEIRAEINTFLDSAEKLLGD